MSQITQLISADGLVANSSAVKERIKERNEQLSQLQAKIDEANKSWQWKEADLRKATESLRGELQRHIVKLDMEEREELNNLVNTLAEERLPLDLQIKELTTQNDRDKELVAPIRKLPAELLSYVFRQFVELNQSPWILNFVCKSWKQISLSTPWLWSHFHIEDADYDSHVYGQQRWTVDGRPVYSIGKRLICRNANEFQTLVSHSGAVSLDVVLHSSSQRPSIEFLQLLLGEPSSNRLRALKVYLSCPKGSIDDLNMGKFRQLQDLTFTAASQDVASFFLGKISLFSSHLERLHSVSSLHTIPPSSPMWKSLRELHLALDPQQQHLNQIISELKRIEVLTGCPSQWPDSGTPHVTLNYIESIVLDCELEYLARLKLLQLQKLRVTDSYTRSAKRSYGHPCELSFPQLAEITVQTSSSVWLSGMSAPSLRTLTWSQHAYGGNLLLFPAVEFPSIKNFSFDAKCTDEVLESALDCVPNVQSLLVAPGANAGNSSKWGLDMLDRLSTIPTFCPHLQKLTMGSTQNRTPTNKSLAKPLIRQAIKTRTQMRNPIKHLEVAWSPRSGKRSETIQYV